MGNINHTITIDNTRKHVHLPCTNEAVCKHIPNVDRSYNRPLDDQRVKEYKDVQIVHYNMHKRLLPIGIIVLCRVGIKYYIIDGGHRLKVFQSLFTDGYRDDKSFLTLEIIDVASTNSIPYWFSMYNRGVEMPPFMFDSSNSKVVNILYECIKSKWKSRISDTRNHTAFKIHLDGFSEFVCERNLAPPDWTRSHCMQILTKWNDLAKALLDRVSDAAKKRCIDNDFYLGIYRGNDDDMANLLRQYNV